MNLLVIVLCVLTERFFPHVSSHHRFQWFNAYSHNVEQAFPKTLHKNPWVALFFVVAPLLFIVALIFYFFSSLLFGFVGLLLHLAVFYYCLGPNNPFYPEQSKIQELYPYGPIGGYLAEVNGQLFAVIFWYIILGPIGVLTYRLISYCRNEEQWREQASLLTAILDWIPSKITSLLYLLVGNFQAGFQHFSSMLLTPPQNNNAMLSICGLQALGHQENEPGEMPRAETLVEHALIVLLVLLAFFTLVAWL